MKHRVLRQILIEEQGVSCAICQVRFAKVMDHDHLTGLIRGLLCGECNALVDRCIHDKNCPIGAYLDEPPLAHLERFHPMAAKWLRESRYVARQRAYDLVMSGGISPGIGFGSDVGGVDPFVPRMAR